MLVNMRQRLLDSAKDVNIGFQLISIVDPQTGVTVSENVRMSTCLLQQPAYQASLIC